MRLYVTNACTDWDQQRAQRERSKRKQFRQLQTLARLDFLLRMRLGKSSIRALSLLLTYGSLFAGREGADAHIDADRVSKKICRFWRRNPELYYQTRHYISGLPEGDARFSTDKN